MEERRALTLARSGGTNSQHGVDSDGRAEPFSGFGRAGPDLIGPRTGRAFDKTISGGRTGLRLGKYCVLIE